MLTASISVMQVFGYYTTILALACFILVETMRIRKEVVKQWQKTQ